MSRNNNMIPEIELKSSQEITLFQEKKLAHALEYISKNSPFYKNLFQKNKIDILKIKQVKELQHIPPTTKEDLQKHNDDFICVPRNKIVDFVTTSGTTGKPVTFALTENDLERLAYNEATSLYCAGWSPGEVYQLMTTIDRRFLAGLAYFLGARKLGSGIIRVGNGIPELQWDSINRIKPSACIGVPSFLLKLIEYADANKIDYQSCSITKAICIGEIIRNPDFSLNILGEKIKKKWDIELYSTYASTEMATAFTECREQKGGHHHPELIIVELLDDYDNAVPDGEEGELTITTLGVEGMPLLRFKTGDICKKHHEPCKCGRNTIRLSPILGRKKQMIKYKGTTIYPPALYDVLNEIEGIKGYVVEVNTSELETDEILIYISCLNVSEAFEKEIKDHFRAKLRVSPSIKFCSADELVKKQNAESNHKTINFIDNRNK